MKKVLFGVASVLAASGAGVSIVAARHQDTIRPNVNVGVVPVGGLTPDDAAKKLRTWWETEKLKTFKIQTDKVKKVFPEMKPSELGVTLDDAASIAQLPLQGFVDNTQAAVTQEEFPVQDFKPIYKAVPVDQAKLAKMVNEAVGKPREARVFYRGGQFVHQTEVSGLQLDKAAVTPAALKAIEDDRIIDLPLKEAPKAIDDEKLKEINEVAAEFTTRFSAGNRPRSSNIKLASSLINGTVLAPGDSFSFNGIVGQRTLKRGFKTAGVYINGKHDTGVGGGICQVSTTLYNAALMADLKIVRRSNHSLPVPYVPVGRDATVNFGAQDLVFKNNYDIPIALAATYEPGRLTFRILGKKQPGLSVQIQRTDLKSWRPSVKTVVDKSLPPGKKKVVEAGATGFSVNTYRLVFQDGKLVRRDPLGRSQYPGGATVIAVGPPKPLTPPGTVPDVMPSVPPGQID